MTKKTDDKKKPNEQSMTLIGLTLYGLIMLSLILIYRDLIITVTCVVIMAVMITQYTVPLIRERKHLQEKKLPSKETEDSADPG